jgi:hypothetical protein
VRNQESYTNTSVWTNLNPKIRSDFSQERAG